MAMFPQHSSSTWFLVQCKPRQDERAEENLQRQGYHCYRPQRGFERIVRGRRQIVNESLFPGYLFIALDADANWAPLRSTRGVSRLVAFNGQPLPVAENLIEDLHRRTTPVGESLPQVGEKILIKDGCFANLEAIFESRKGDERVVLLLTILNQLQRVEVSLASIRKS